MKNFHSKAGMGVNSDMGVISREYGNCKCMCKSGQIGANKWGEPPFAGFLRPVLSPGGVSLWNLCWGGSRISVNGGAENDKTAWRSSSENWQGRSTILTKRLGFSVSGASRLVRTVMISSAHGGIVHSSYCLKRQPSN